MWMWRSGWKSDLTPRSSGLQLAQEGILHDSKKEEEKETEKGGKKSTHWHAAVLLVPSLLVPLCRDYAGATPQH
jgi:hypothetical protein